MEPTSRVIHIILPQDLTIRGREGDNGCPASWHNQNISNGKLRCSIIGIHRWKFCPPECFAIHAGQGVYSLFCPDEYKLIFDNGCIQDSFLCFSHPHRLRYKSSPRDWLIQVLWNEWAAHNQ